MNTLVRRATLVVLSTLGLTVFAETGKTPLRVNFNQMIEEGARDRRQIHDNLNESTTTAARDDQKPVAATRRGVIDFIDMEVGVGDDAHLVDRR